MEKLLATIDIGKEFKINGETGIGQIGTVGNIISTLLQNIYVLAGIILFVLLIVGGLSFIMGAGEENPEKAKKGKQAITAALTGFVIIFCSYWIIRIIEIITGMNIFNPNF
ncbi:MAG: hypothetical protein NT052_02265 [Candidatus Shapirobacteria bacterium]|nr:hypothetical protein [Candidatus Shapirobacteria bacterium]